ncbi:MAG: hypothetical protein NTY77_09395 [Elusimicrobia bacterium]|nr:hypothetical protein [Elusimicrobiota bacterium]
MIGGPSDPVRRMQGGIFITAGAAHVLLMIFASLYTLGKFPGLVISTHRWHMAYSSVSFYVVFVSAAMIIMQHFKTEVFLPQAILDLLAGAVPFHALFWAARRILARWEITPWISLLPGLFLVYCGLKLWRGRALSRSLEFD